MGKKIFILFFIAFIVGHVLKAQDKENDNDTIKKWEFGGVGSLNFSQVSLQNWASGGQNSVSGNSFINMFLNYNKEKISWENSLDLAYGLITQGEKGERQTLKSDDKIEFSSKYGRKILNRKLYYSAMIDFKTQFAPGYNKPDDTVKISDFLSPAYLVVSLGLDYKPADYISILMSPLTGKMTIVKSDYLSDQGAFGVDSGKMVRNEFGGFMKIKFKEDIFKNVGVESKINLFSNYIDNPKNIDVDWETMIALKVNEFLSANIKTHLIYDDDIVFNDDKGKDKSRIQFKEIMGIGLSFKF